MNQVTVILDDGRTFEGDVLVGADGIWSKVSHVDMLSVQNICNTICSDHMLKILGAFKTFWSTRSSIFKLYVLQWTN